MLFPVALLFIYPFIWMFFSGFKTNKEIYQSTQLLPQSEEFRTKKAKALQEQNAVDSKALRFKEKREIRAKIRELESIQDQVNYSPQEIPLEDLKAKLKALEGEIVKSKTYDSDIVDPLVSVGQDKLIGFSILRHTHQFKQAQTTIDFK